MNESRRKQFSKRITKCLKENGDMNIQDILSIEFDRSEYTFLRRTISWMQNDNKLTSYRTLKDRRIRRYRLIQ